MKQGIATSMVLGASLVLILGSACSKGSTLGGTEAEPAAVETAGVPEYVAAHEPAEGEHTEGEHDNIATPSEQQHSGVQPGHSTETVGASSAGDLEPDGGNIQTTTADTTSTQP